MEKTYNGTAIHVNDQGYLTDFNEWNREVGMEIAAEEEIEMTDEHWEVIDYIQDQYAQKVPLSIRGIKNSGVINIKDFYRLFPGGPLKKASKIAGIPKPVSCI
jgi:tRNA 2-thiouridine synthesizing protein E